MKNQELDQKTKEALAKELKKQEKEVINNSKVSNLIDADLDNKSLMTELAKITIKDKQVNSNSGMFRFNTLIDNFDTLSKEEKKKLTKPLRRKLRNKRDNLLISIVKQFKANDLKELKKTIKEFNIFYKESYLLNDYSINSIARSSSDKENIIFITLALQVVKNNK